jgi:FAD/FMN-containing dehydrogenase/SAM-dependent methyltransferase
MRQTISRNLNLEFSNLFSRGWNYLKHLKNELVLEACKMNIKHVCVFRFLKTLAVLFFLSSSPLVALENKPKEIYLAEKVAAGNDWLLSLGETSPFLKPLTSIAARTMSVTLFPMCTAVDMTLLAASQACQAPHLLLNKKSCQNQEQYRKKSEALKKSSLGLLMAPIGVFSPDIVTHHFIPNQIQNFQIIPYGKLYSTRAQMSYPQSVAEIQLIINEAKQARQSISILGKAMCQGKQTISNKDWNIVINTSKLNQISIDPKLKIAKVGPGVSWAQLQNEANQYGLAVKVMQASNIFSIGGSISANCHGWDYKTGCLRNALIALTIINAEGKVLEINPDDPLFDFVVGGYGGFGLIVEATISLTDNVKLIQSGVEIDPSEYVNYFNQNIRYNDDIDMHLYRLSLEPKHLFQTGIAVNYRRVSNEPVVANLVDEPAKGTALDRVKIHTVRRLPWLRKLAWNIAKKEALAEKILSRNEFMRPPINPVFNNSKIDTEWLQEYFVKGEDLVDFLQFLGHILQRNHVALFNASVRFVKQDAKTKLSYAQAGDRFAVVLFFNQKLSSKEIQKTKKWVRQVIDYLIAHGGSYYLPYQHFATLEQFKACYPNRQAIISYKQSIDSSGLFSNGFFQDYLTPDLEQDSLFHKVFNSVSGQRAEVRDFLNNVFMQLDEKSFFTLMDSILENSELSDQQIYASLFSKISQSKPSALSKFQLTLKSLKSLKNDLGDQTAHLIGERKIKGYVEIGYPGRMLRPLKNRLQIKGPFYAITDKERMTDYVEAGFPRPYDRFVPLNDYAPISETMIPTSSVDLVCMYIGLHHAPVEKLEAFIESVKRILRPGGIFILMDHDAHSIELKNLVHVVHSIFNAATGVEPEMNDHEIRNFQSLKHWIDLLQSHGMIHYQHAPLVRDGDSTLNSLIRFDKPTTQSTHLEIAESLILDPDYQRPQIQTYLTAPEWQNVRAAQRYAAFVENEPAYRYPYFREITGFWKTYGHSWLAAQQQKEFIDIALSEYNLMNLFVGTTMTLEYGTKGLIAAPFALLDKVFDINKKSCNKAPSDKERLRSLKEYGRYIENTPFYKYPYFSDIRSYWKTYFRENSSLGSRIKGLFVGTGMTLEYTLKGLVATPMSCFYGSDAMKEAETTHLIVLDQENMIETIDSNIVVLEKSSDNSLKHVEIPRYMHFTNIMLKIANDPSLSCLNIAGHDKIQIDVKSPKSGIKSYNGATLLYEIPAPSDLKYKFFALEVEVSQLCEVIRLLKKDNIEVLFIHDY